MQISVSLCSPLFLLLIAILYDLNIEIQGPDSKYQTSLFKAYAAEVVKVYIVVTTSSTNQMRI